MKRVITLVAILAVVAVSCYPRWTLVVAADRSGPALNTDLGYMPVWRARDPEGFASVLGRPQSKCALVADTGEQFTCFVAIAAVYALAMMLAAFQQAAWVAAAQRRSP